MKSLLSILVFAMAAICVAPMVNAQQMVTENIMSSEDGKLADATVEDAAWIAGSWKGDALGGVAEETWSAPSGGTMLGMFKLTKDGETVFSEIMSIVPMENSIAMVLKHFNADMTGWEEKDEYESFPLLKITPDALYFDGLTIRKKGSKKITVYVSATGEGGKLSELKFAYTKVD